MKTSPIRRLRLMANALVIVILTLLGHSFYLQWQQKKHFREAITLCQLPAPPAEFSLHHAFLEETKSGTVFISFSVSSSMTEMDAWLEKVDEWKKSNRSVETYALRESRTESRIDFSAEIRPKKKSETILISAKYDIFSPPVSR